MINEIIMLIVAYGLGSISFAYLIGKIFYKKDVRNEGSKNLGSTNSFRVLGKRAGTIVLICDIGKGFLACYIAEKANVDLHVLFFGVAAIIGHCYSIFLKFKGGKAVATTAGVLLYVDVNIFLIAIGIFLITLALTKMVSLSSIVGTSMGALISIFMSEKEIMITMIVLAIFIIFKHKENIKRIKNHQEPKVGKKNK